MYKENYPWLITELTQPDILTVISATLAAQRVTGVVPLLIGIPGNAKTSLVEKMGEVIGHGCHVLSAARMNPEDLNGPMVLSSDRSTFDYCTPAWAVNAHPNTLIFADEVNQGSTRTEAALMRFLLEGSVGNVNVPSYRIAAMNPPHASTGGRPFGAPTANRFCHIPWAASIDAFEDWASGNQGFYPPAIPDVTSDEVKAEVIASVIPTIKNGNEVAKLECLPDNPEHHQGPWASQRTWTSAAGIVCALRKLNKLHLVEDACAMVIGRDAAAVYAKHVLVGGLPSPEDLINAPNLAYKLGSGVAMQCITAAIKLCSSHPTLTFQDVEEMAADFTDDSHFELANFTISGLLKLGYTSRRLKKMQARILQAIGGS